MARLKTTKQINTNIKQVNTNTPSINTLINNHNHSHRNISKEHSNSSDFMIYHQNIRGISKKTDEFLISVCNNRPQIVCLTEHHLTAEEINSINLDPYKLGVSFCRQKYKYGGACIYISKFLEFSTINLEKYHKEKDLEICALKLNMPTKNYTIIGIYRSPIGDFTYFLTNLEIILNELDSISNELIICGDFNIDYMKETSKKKFFRFNFKLL